MGLRLNVRDDDTGIALPMVLGAVALILVLVTAGFYASSQVLHEAQLANSHDAAYQAASSGVTVALADLRTKLATPPAQTTYVGSLDAGAAAYAATATLNAASTGYDCVSVGIAADGTTETVIAQFTIVAAGTAGGAGGSIWGKDIFYPGTMTGSITGNGMFTGPVYISFPGTAANNTLTFGSAASGFAAGPIYIQNGNLVIKNSPAAPVDVYTNGTVTASNPSLFINHGWDASYAFTLVPVVTSTFLASAQQSATTQSSDNRMGYSSTAVVNYESSPTAVPASYASASTDPPNNRPAGWLRSRAPGAASAYKLTSGSLTLDSSTASFGSWTGDGHYPTTSGLHDDFAYDAANGVLYVEGLVYVGGDLTVNKALKYVGGGTIVCSGKVTFNSSVVPATANGPDGTPDPAANAILGVFSVGNCTVNGNKTVVTAALYTTSQIDVTANNVTLKGSFIAEKGMTNFPNNLNLIAVPAISGYAPQALPTGQSGSGTSSGNGSLTLSMTGWRRG
jgi:hypothetical protein